MSDRVRDLPTVDTHVGIHAQTDISGSRMVFLQQGLLLLIFHRGLNRSRFHANEAVAGMGSRVVHYIHQPDLPHFKTAQQYADWFNEGDRLEF